MSSGSDLPPTTHVQNTSTKPTFTPIIPHSLPSSPTLRTFLTEVLVHAGFDMERAIALPTSPPTSSRSEPSEEERFLHFMAHAARQASTRLRYGQRENAWTMVSPFRLRDHRITAMSETHRLSVALGEQFIRMDKQARHVLYATSEDHDMTVQGFRQSFRTGELRKGGKTRVIKNRVGITGLVHEVYGAWFILPQYGEDPRAVGEGLAELLLLEDLTPPQVSISEPPVSSTPFPVSSSSLPPGESGTRQVTRQLPKEEATRLLAATTPPKDRKNGGDR